MTMGAAPRLEKFLLVDDYPVFRFAIREALWAIANIEAEASTEQGALHHLASDQTFDGVVCDLELTDKGLEGLRILEEAERRGIRKLVLFTQNPSRVPKTWRDVHPRVKVVEKGGLAALLLGVKD